MYISGVRGVQLLIVASGWPNNSGVSTAVEKTKSYIVWEWGCNPTNPTPRGGREAVYRGRLPRPMGGCTSTFHPASSHQLSHL